MQSNTLHRSTLLLCLVLGASTAFSQSIFRVGPAVGLNMASLSIEGTSDNSIHAGAVIGAVVEFGFFGGTAISIQPHFVQKGTTLEQPNKVFGTTVQYSGPTDLNYIEIPVVLKYTFASIPLKPNFFFGPDFGFLLSANARQLVDSVQSTQDVSNHMKSTDVALDVGVGIEFAILPLTSITSDLRYSFGLSNTNDSGPSFKTRDVKIIVGVLFGF